MRGLFAAIGLCATALGLACAATEAPRCRSGADCDSGMCSRDGRCLDGAAAASTGAGGSATSGGGAPEAGAGGVAGCQPDHDGVIAADELPFAVGLHEKLLSAQNVTFDSAGTDAGGGTRRWDFSAAQPGDHLTLVETRALDGTWFGDLYPGASYAARLSDAEELLGVFEIAGDALLLRGVVSPDDGPTRTELRYDPPVVVLDLPLSEGKIWSATSSVTGWAQGVAAFYSEQYDFAVDARGEALTPFATFEVLRVHSTLRRTVGALVTIVQQHSFVSACFGSVAALTSQPNQLSTDFHDVAEMRRLSP